MAGFSNKPRKARLRRGWKREIFSMLTQTAQDMGEVSSTNIDEGGNPRVPQREGQRPEVAC